MSDSQILAQVADTICDAINEIETVQGNSNEQVSEALNPIMQMLHNLYTHLEDTIGEFELREISGERE